MSSPQSTRRYPDLVDQREGRPESCRRVRIRRDAFSLMLKLALIRVISVYTNGSRMPTFV